MHSLSNQYQSNIVHHNLLTIRELRIMFEELESTGLTPLSLNDIYNFISVTSFYHGNHLIFSFDVPRVSETIYEKMRIEPLPTNGKMIDLGRHSTFLVSKTEVLSVLQNEKSSIFRRNELLNITDACIVPLFQVLKGKCPFKEITLQTQVQLLTFGTIIVKSALNTTLSSTCGINEKQLYENNMIIFHNCSVIIQNQLFKNLELQFNHPNILPIKSTQIVESHLEKQFNLSVLHEAQKVNRHHLKSLRTYQHSSLGGILVIILIIIAALAYIQWNAITAFFKKRTGRALTRGGGVNNELALRTSTEVPTTFPTTSPPRIILTPTTTTNQLTQHHTASHRCCAPSFPQGSIEERDCKVNTDTACIINL
ncbi:uncharacterized protein LOC119770195 [Culex quinquefasciatus]|uniref:uncharacterized protein LOC119770195 n=1 Tax=Culex quinquefasciatus TaxID=7176 RepID=UPI0018E326DF|nr:uncharacterized protein LOC119770195 [Culex quinquefasciatus]